MANFGGVNGITDLEAKTAQIIDEYFVKNGPLKLLNWMEDNKINSLYWWDYFETKNKSNSVPVPFCHFDKLGKQTKGHSMRYLEIPYEVAIKIVTLGFLSVN